MTDCVKRTEPMEETMRKIPTTLAAAILAASVSFAAPVQADEPTPPECEVVGEATCEPATCEDEAVVYRATIAQLERQTARIERRIDRKNSTIKRLRAALAAQR